MKKIIIFVLILILLSACYMGQKPTYTVNKDVEVISTDLIEEVSLSDLLSVIFIITEKQKFSGYSDEARIYYNLKNKNYIKEIEKGDRVRIRQGNLLGPGPSYSVVFTYKNQEYFWCDRSMFTDSDVEGIRNQYRKQNFSNYFDEL